MEARRPGLLRLLAATLAGGALLGAAAATDVSFGPAAAGPATRTTEGPAEPDQGSYLSEALLACPGTDEETDHDASRQTRVRAVTAPQEVFAQVQAPDGEQGGVELQLVDGVLEPTPGAGAGGEASEDLPAVLDGTLDHGGWGSVRAHGMHAPGLVGAQLSLAPGAGDRGLTLAPCTPAADVIYLVGGGDGAGRVELVVVTNPSSDPVTVDIDVFGEDGATRTVGGSGLVVPGEGQLVRRLDALAPSVQHPVVRVVAQGGPVAAHLAERHREGTTDLGQEMVAPAAMPAHELVVPALPGPQEADQARSLRIFAPDGDAVVELRVLTVEGAHVPGTAVVRVPGGSTAEVPLDDLPEGANALRLRADAPVTAGALLQVAPVSDEPIEVGQEPDDVATTAGPDEAATTAGPDDAATTAGPDDAATTAGPQEEGTAQEEPVRHPAGESAWVAAVPLSRVPLGMALPELRDLPRFTESGADDQSDPVVELAVSAVDATTASVLWLDEAGAVRTEDLRLANDTTQLLPVRPGTVAFWILPTGGEGLAAALHLTARDVVGPYLAAASVPPVPWTQQVPAVVPVRP